MENIYSIWYIEMFREYDWHIPCALWIVMYSLSILIPNPVSPNSALFIEEE